MLSDIHLPIKDPKMMTSLSRALDLGLDSVEDNPVNYQPGLPVVAFRYVDYSLVLDSFEVSLQRQIIRRFPFAIPPFSTSLDSSMFIF